MSLTYRIKGNGPLYMKAKEMVDNGASLDDLRKTFNIKNEYYKVRESDGKLTPEELDDITDLYFLLHLEGQKKGDLLKELFSAKDSKNQADNNRLVQNIGSRLEENEIKRDIGEINKFISRLYLGSEVADSASTQLKEGYKKKNGKLPKGL